MVWVGIRGLILVIVWGYGVGVMRSLTGFMGMVVRFLVTLGLGFSGWVGLGLNEVWVIVITGSLG